MVEKDSALFPWKRPKNSTRLLQPESEALSRPETDAHFDRWEVEALGDEVATRKYRDPSGAKAGDRQGSNLSRGIAVDALGGESGFSEGSGPSPSGVNGDVEDDGARAGGNAPVVLDAISRNCRSIRSFNNFPTNVITRSGMESVGVDGWRREDSNACEIPLPNKFFMGGSYDEVIKDNVQRFA